MFFFFLPLWWKCWFPVFQIPSHSLALCDPGSGLRCGTCTNTHMPAHTHIPEHSSSCPRSSSLRTQTRDLSSGSPPKFEFTRFPRCRGKRKGAGPTVFATVSADCKCWEMNRPVLLVPGFDLSSQCEKSLNSDTWCYSTEVLVNNGGKISWNAFIFYFLLFYFLFLASYLNSV